MKKTLAFFTLLLGCVAMFAQSGPAFPYQAVVRNAQNQLIKDSTFAIGVEVFQGEVQKYSETQSATTNANGQFTMNIGGGAVVSGAMNNVTDWSVAKFKITYHLSGGDVVSEQLVHPVPYALQADNVVEEQVLTLSNDTIYLTGGSYVKLPDYVLTATMNERLADTLNQYTLTSQLCEVVNNCDLTGNASLMAILNAMDARIDSLAHIVDSLSSLPHGGGNTPAATFTCGTSKVKDVDNNEYNTVKIGNQCWMKENLRTNVGGGVYPKNGDTELTADEQVTYGRLYTWNAMMNNTAATNYPESGLKVQGICPEGWHVPSNAEWNTLTRHVFNSTSPNYKCGSSCGSWSAQGTVSCIANALSAETGWYTPSECCAGYSSATLNTTGFAAVPAGFCFDGFDGFGEFAYFWSATDGETTHAWILFLSNENSTVEWTGANKDLGLSVRCLRDAGIGGTPGENETGGETSVYDTVFCYPNLGANTPDTNKVTRGESFSLSTVTFTHPVETNNWEIASWNTSADGSGTRYERDTTITTTGNLTLYAQWRTFCTGTSSANEVGTDNRIDSVKDVDNNKYAVVKIGNQCWMKENLRTSSVNGKGNTWNPGTGDNTANEVNVPTYGRLYDWAAVMQVANANTNMITVENKHQGICPEGWHVPSDAEWDTLTHYVFSKDEYKCGNDCGEWQAQSNVSCIAKALASTTGWDSNTSEGCNAGNMGDKANATGFSAVPAGFRLSGYFYVFGSDAYFWSATQDDDDKAWYRYLGSHVSRVYWYNDGSKGLGHSVRCLRDAETGGGDEPETPDTPGGEPTIVDTVTCYPNLGANESVKKTVTRGQNIDLSTVTFTHPVETNNWEIASWNTSADGTGTSYTNTLTTSGNLTLYAQWRTFCTGTPSDNEVGNARIDSLKDVDNNKYAVVQIGSQCWMKENMKTTQYANGTAIASDKMFNPNGSEGNVAIYGKLYSWSAATRDSSTTYPEAGQVKVQGICPAGWHVPSDAEWDTLTHYVFSKDEYKCGDMCGTWQAQSNVSCIAKALSSTTGWSINNNSDCNAGNTGGKANLTGFSAVPAGGCFFGNPGSFSYGAYFWSATLSSNESLAWLRHPYSDVHYVERETGNKVNGFSIRCVRDRFNCGTDTVKDVQNNSYTTVKIGEQCWMKQNLRTNVGGGVYPQNNGVTVTGADTVTYGRLYTWDAVMNGESSTNYPVSGNKVKGICPTGWHVPSEAEWTQLTDYVSSVPKYLCQGEAIANALSDSTGWMASDTYCGAGQTGSTTINRTGFSAVPAGYWRNNGTNYFGTCTDFWSATSCSVMPHPDGARSFYLFSQGTDAHLNCTSKSDGYSVRCLLD